MVNRAWAKLIMVSRRLLQFMMAWHHDLFILGFCGPSDLSIGYELWFLLPHAWIAIASTQFVIPPRVKLDHILQDRLYVSFKFVRVQPVNVRGLSQCVMFCFTDVLGFVMFWPWLLSIVLQMTFLHPSCSLFSWPTMISSESQSMKICYRSPVHRFTRAYQSTSPFICLS